MAKINIQGKQLKVSFSPRERHLLGRPDLSLELQRITDVSVVSRPKTIDLGRKVSKSSLFGGPTGEYRSGSKKILLLGRSSSYIRINLSHPSVDEVWVGSSHQSALGTAESITFAIKK